MHQIDAFNLKNVRNILLAEWALDRPQWSEDSHRCLTKSCGKQIILTNPTL